LNEVLVGRIRAIAQVADAWLSSKSQWMRQAEEKLPGASPYSKKMVRACLERTFRHYDELNLFNWVNKEGFPQKVSFSKIKKKKKKKVIIFAPSTVFAATWQAAVPAWLAGYDVSIKPSKNEPEFAKLFKKSIQGTVGNLLPLTILNSNTEVVGRRFSPPSFTIKGGQDGRPTKKGKMDFDKFVLYGSDSTLATLQTKIGKKNLIGFGSRFSIAVVGKSFQGNLNDLVQKAAFDAILYDTQGCLSPQCFFIHKNSKISAQKFAKALSLAMSRNNRLFPPASAGCQGLREAESFWQHWKFRESQGSVQIFGNHVILDPKKEFEPCGLNRVVFVKPFQSLEELADQLREWKKKISTVATSDSEIKRKLQNVFRGRSDIRYCGFGQMHEPLPDWANGGVHLLREFCHSSS
jgi:hypothetical protein